jgi:sugar phosphate isomerase/epimerase
LKLGLFTAAFPGRSLESVADFAAAEGYSCLELACWPPSAADRRYAGVTTLDVVGLDRAKAAAARKIVEERGLSISALGYYANPLFPDPAVRAAAAAQIRALIDAAALLKWKWSAPSWARTRTRPSLPTWKTSPASGRPSWPTPKSGASRSP